MRKIAKAAISTASVLVLISACAGISGTDTTTTEAPLVDDTKVSSGLGSKDATADVKVKGGKAYTEYGSTSVPVVVTNNSEKMSDYWITIAAESKDGSEQYETALVSVDSLRPGQSKTEEAMFFEAVPAGAAFVLLEVQRTAS